MKSLQVGYPVFVDAYDQALAICPNNSLYLNAKGLALFNKSSHKEAIKVFEKATM